MRPGLTRSTVERLKAALGIGRTAIFERVRRGMPTEPEAARTWIEHRRRRSPGVGVARRRRSRLTLAESWARAHGEAAEAAGDHESD